MSAVMSEICTPSLDALDFRLLNWARAQHDSGPRLATMNYGTSCDPSPDTLDAEFIEGAMVQINQRGWIDHFCAIHARYLDFRCSTWEEVLQVIRKKHPALVGAYGSGVPAVKKIADRYCKQLQLYV